MEKLICDHCSNLATWLLMSGPGQRCDAHVPRGCSCEVHTIMENFDGELVNDLPEGIEGKDWKWFKKDISWVHLDSLGREYPCCEWWYKEEGWEPDE